MEDDNHFKVFRPGDTFYTANLRAIAEFYEEKYFPETEPIQEVELVTELDGPACYFPEHSLIEVSETLGEHIKLCRFLVLHELINKKLFKIHGKRIEYDSPEFQQELDRLWVLGAYRDIL